MKNFNIIIFTLSLTACSTMKFDKNINCSPRALNYLNREATDTSLENGSKLQKTEALRAIMKSITGDLQKCYQDYINRGQDEKYAICLVMNIDNYGNRAFLDIDDHSRILDPELHQCLLRNVETTDFSKVKSATVIQPLLLHGKRK